MELAVFLLARAGNLTTGEWYWHTEFSRDGNAASYFFTIARGTCCANSQAPRQTPNCYPPQTHTLLPLRPFSVVWKAVHITRTPGQVYQTDTGMEGVKWSLHTMKLYLKADETKAQNYIHTTYVAGSGNQVTVAKLLRSSWRRQWVWWGCSPGAF